MMSTCASSPGLWRGRPHSHLLASLLRICHLMHTFCAFMCSCRACTPWATLSSFIPTTVSSHSSLHSTDRPARGFQGFQCRPRQHSAPVGPVRHVLHPSPGRRGVGGGVSHHLRDTWAYRYRQLPSVLISHSSAIAISEPRVCTVGTPEPARCCYLLCAVTARGLFKEVLPPTADTCSCQAC